MNLKMVVVFRLKKRTRACDHLETNNWPVDNKKNVTSMGRYFKPL